jgi:hypothetical protein
MKINWPKIRISVPDFVGDLERLARQLGVSGQLEEQIIEEQAQKLAGGNILSWQLRLLSRVCLRAAVIKDSKPWGPDPR